MEDGSSGLFDRGVFSQRSFWESNFIKEESFQKICDYIPAYLF